MKLLRDFSTCQIVKIIRKTTMKKLSLLVASVSTFSVQPVLAAEVDIKGVF